MSAHDSEKTRKAIEALAGLSADERRRLVEDMSREDRQPAVQNYATEALSKLDSRIDEVEKAIDKLEDSREAGKSACYGIGGIGVTMSAMTFFVGGALDAALSFGAVTATIAGIGGLEVHAENRKIKKEQKRLAELKEERKLLLTALTPPSPVPGHPSSLLKLASTFNPAPGIDKSPSLPADARPRPPEQNR